MLVLCLVTPVHMQVDVTVLEEHVAFIVSPEVGGSIFFRNAGIFLQARRLNMNIIIDISHVAKLCFFCSCKSCATTAKLHCCINSPLLPVITHLQLWNIIPVFSYHFTCNLIHPEILWPFHWHFSLSFSSNNLWNYLWISISLNCVQIMTLLPNLFSHFLYNFNLHWLHFHHITTYSSATKPTYNISVFHGLKSHFAFLIYFPVI
jgi:hypothetical protein